MSLNAFNPLRIAINLRRKHLAKKAERRYENERARHIARIETQLISASRNLGFVTEPLIISKLAASGHKMSSELISKLIQIANQAKRANSVNKVNNVSSVDTVNHVAHQRLAKSKASSRHMGSEKSQAAFKGQSRVLIGPTNSANQASEWANALRHSGVAAKSLRISIEPGLEWFTTDLEIKHEDRISEDFRVALANSELVPASALLLESLRPIFGFRKRKGFTQTDAIDDLLLARRMGKRVGAIFHGSDIRDVDNHAANNSFSPFHQERPEVADLRARATVNRKHIAQLQNFGIPIFVTTLDLFHEVPDAIWLPPVIDIDKFVEVRNAPLYTSEKLRVLYLPSKSWIKSSELILPILEKLASEGVIEFENHVANGAVKHDQVPDLLAKADVVVDQFLGVVGVFPLEVLAAGRHLLTYVPENYPSDMTPPHHQITPDSLEQVLRDLAANRPQPEDGLDLVRKWHDGNYSREVLRALAG